MRALLIVALVLALGHTSAMAATRHRTVLDTLMPAPEHYSVVYDGGAGYDPGSTDAQSIGQYADTNTNTVHTTRGFTPRMIAQDVGQIFGYSVLTPGDRTYFSKMLGTDPTYWTDLHANSGHGNEAGDEAFADYYSVAATGGLKHGEGLLLGNTSIDPTILHKYTAALSRLGKRRGLPPLHLLDALASAD